MINLCQYRQEVREPTFSVTRHRPHPRTKAGLALMILLCEPMYVPGYRTTHVSPFGNGLRSNARDEQMRLNEVYDYLESLQTRWES